MTDAAALPTAQGRVIGLPLLAFVFAVACTALPLLAHLYLPLVDLPNHIARLHVAATGGTGPLADYYSYSANLVPNAAIDLLWRGLGYPMGAERFANLVMASYAVNMVLSVMVLARVVHGRWTLWSAAAGLLVYSGPFFWGFQNFVWSLPFCLYALALWLVMEPRSTALRAAVFVPIGLALYLMHFFVFGFLAILVFGRELQTLIALRDGRLRGFLARVGLMVPFLLPLIWLAVTLHGAGPSPSGSHTAFGPLSARVRMFAFLFFAPNALEFPLLNLLGTISLGLLALAFARLFARRGPRLILAPQLRGAAIALAVAALCAPTWLNGVALVDIRAPILLCAVLIAGSTWHGLAPRPAMMLAVLVGVLILARGVAFERFAARYEADVQDMLTATESLPAGARLLPLRGPDLQRDTRFYHLQGLLVAQREVFVPTLFQGVHTMTLHDKWADYAHPALFAIDYRLALDPEFSALTPVFAVDWANKFTHALLMDDVAPPQDPQLQPVAKQGRFTLFAVTPTD